MILYIFFRTHITAAILYKKSNSEPKKLDVQDVYLAVSPYQPLYVKNSELSWRTGYTIRQIAGVSTCVWARMSVCVCMYVCDLWRNCLVSSTWVCSKGGSRSWSMMVSVASSILNQTQCKPECHSLEDLPPSVSQSEAASNILCSCSAATSADIVARWLL